MAQPATVLRAVKAAVESKASESGQRNAVQGTLARYGYFKLPKVQSFNDNRRTVRAYVWVDVGGRDLLLITGPSIVGEVRFARQDEYHDTEETGVFVPANRDSIREDARAAMERSRDRNREDAGTITGRAEPKRKRKPAAKKPARGRTARKPLEEPWTRAGAPKQSLWERGPQTRREATDGEWRRTIPTWVGQSLDSVVGREAWETARAHKKPGSDDFLAIFWTTYNDGIAEKRIPDDLTDAQTYTIRLEQADILRNVLFKHFRKQSDYTEQLFRTMIDELWSRYYVDLAALASRDPAAADAAWRERARDDLDRFASTLLAETRGKGKSRRDLRSKAEKAIVAANAATNRLAEQRKWADAAVRDVHERTDGGNYARVGDASLLDIVEELQGAMRGIDKSATLGLRAEVERVQAEIDKRESVPVAPGRKGKAFAIPQYALSELDVRKEIALDPDTYGVTDEERAAYKALYDHVDFDESKLYVPTDVAQVKLIEDLLQEIANGLDDAVESGRSPDGRADRAASQGLGSLSSKMFRVSHAARKSAVPMHRRPTGVELDGDTIADKVRKVSLLTKGKIAEVPNYTDMGDSRRQGGFYRLDDVNERDKTVTFTRWRLDGSDESTHTSPWSSFERTWRETPAPARYHPGDEPPTGTRLTTLFDDRSKQNTAIKRLLKDAAPSVKWSVKSGAGTSWGWTQVKGTGGTDRDHQRANSLSDRLHMGRLGRNLSNSFERSDVTIPSELIDVATGKAKQTRKPKPARTDRPEPGKLYSLTGGDKSIAGGASWADSEVVDKPDPYAMTVHGLTGGPPEIISSNDEPDDADPEVGELTSANPKYVEKQGEWIKWTKGENKGMYAWRWHGMTYASLVDTRASYGNNSTIRFETEDGERHETLRAAKLWAIESEAVPGLQRDGYLPKPRVIGPGVTSEPDDDAAMMAQLAAIMKQALSE